MRRAVRWLIVGVVLAVLVVLGPARGVLGRWIGPDRPYSPDHQRLLDAIQPVRPIPARLSGGSPHKPYRPLSSRRSASRKASDPATRSETQETDLSSELPIPRDVAKAIQRDGEGKAAPEHRSALAALKLLDGNPEGAAALLRDAHNQSPEDPRILNDLAAALLTVHETTGDPWRAVEALETALQAERLEATLPVLFNKALALQELGARTRAIAAWDRYLERDAGSDWAQEARQRRDGLEREARRASKLPTVPAADVTAFEDNPWANRQLAERTLLARWAEHTLAGRSAEAEAALSQAEILAATLTPDAGRLLNASIAVIREAEQTRERARIDLLARGHQAFGQAFLLRREERTSEAGKFLEVAIRDLQAAGSPFELRARLLRAWMAEPPDWSELQRLQEEAETGGFPQIAAEALRIAAFRISLEGRLEPALDVYQDARRRFEALGEREEAAVVAIMNAEILEALGREQEAAGELAFALGAGPWVADPYNRYSLYVVAASSAVGRFARAAVKLRQEAADACRDLPERPLCDVDSWLAVAAYTPDDDVAQDALQQAEDHLPAAPDSDGKERTGIELAMARAGWLADEDRSTAEKEEAAALFAKVATRQDSRDRPVSAARARAARARILQSLGRTAEAIDEYRTSLRNFRRWDQSDRFRPDRAEKRSPAELRQVYEALIGLELDAAGRGPSPAAFLLSEEMHDRLAPRRTADFQLPSAADLQRFAAAVPSGTAVIEYAIAGERTVAWILAGGHFDQVVLTPGDDLGGRIRALDTHRRERDLGGWRRTSAALFRDLVAPLLKRLPSGTTRLVLIPDSELYGVPFRALWDPGSGRYLDETFTLTLAPSARQIFTPQENRAPGPGALRVLSLGFTNFLPALGLDRLPEAAREAAAVRAIHGGGACPAEDWRGFRRCAPQAAVLHLSTHAAADSASDWTWLAFEEETVSLDRLWSELPDLPLRPLVVLSACQSVTAAGGEGLGGLARPFLASGARAVVGTLWKINDEDAAALFPAFHRAYRASAEPSEALRKARAEFKDWRSRPWIWGGVQVVTAGF